MKVIMKEEMAGNKRKGRKKGKRRNNDRKDIKQKKWQSMAEKRERWKEIRKQREGNELQWVRYGKGRKKERKKWKQALVKQIRKKEKDGDRRR